MRKRSEAGPVQPAEKPLGGEWTRLPIEDDPSAMHIALKGRGYEVGVQAVRDWAEGPRHLVAMWLTGALSEDDIPEAIRGLKKRASVDLTSPPPAPAKAAGKLCTETVALVEGELLSAPDTVTVSFGSEKFYPVAKSYNNFEVGMLSMTVHVQPGQDRLQVARAAHADMRKLREEFREAQRLDFLRSLKGMLSDEKS